MSSPNPVLAAIRSRRVARALTGEPVERAALEEILRAARFAPNAGNRHLQHFVIVQDPAMLRVLRMVSPGMLQRPPAVIAICVDWERAEAFGLPPANRGAWIDVGTAAQTMLLAAHALGVASGPVTSFSRAAVARVLNLPARWSAELLVCLGHAAEGGPPPMRRGVTADWRHLTHWERFPQR